jgi:hypothetical protein
MRDQRSSDEENDRTSLVRNRGLEVEKDELGAQIPLTGSKQKPWRLVTYD